MHVVQRSQGCNQCVAKAWTLEGGRLIVLCDRGVSGEGDSGLEKGRRCPARIPVLRPLHLSFHSVQGKGRGSSSFLAFILLF
jgi:hypothetical protein